MDEKETDLAEGTFVEKMPVWLRWILFLPAAFIGSIIAVVIIGVINWLSMRFTGYTENGWWYQIFQLFQSFMLGLFFVIFGATVIPKGQFATSIVLMVIITIISVLVFLTNQVTHTQSTLLFLLHCALVVAGGGYAVFIAHKGEPLGDSL